MPKKGNNEPLAKKPRVSLQSSSESAQPESQSENDLEVDDEFDDDESSMFSDSNSIRKEVEREAETGIIEMIRLKNFMCHSHLEFQFGPNVNFILGRNGSGKSAVITALVVGLGGKATVTNRAGSIKSFIKDGTNVAEVVIRLRNTGEEAYNPSEFGTSILIERRLSQDGSSSYKLKNGQTGKLVSIKREVLTRILDCFNIQVDNPVTVLNQDTSKNFLHSKNPTDKYKFFLKATQLDQMSSDYLKIEEQKTLMTETVKKKEEGLPAMEKEVLEKEEKYKALTSIQELHAKLDKLKEEAVWVQVREMEKGMEPLEANIKKEEKRQPKFEEKVKESTAAVKEAEGQINQFKEQLSKLSDQMKRKQPQHDKLKKEFDVKKKAFRDIQNQCRQLGANIRSVMADKVEMEKRIEELENVAKRDYDAERQLRQQEIEELEEKLSAAECSMQNINRDVDQLTKSISHYKEQLYSVRQQRSTVNRELTALSQEVETLKSSRANRLRLYGNYMPELIKKIDVAFNRKQFHQKPLGPLGTFLKLPDNKWAMAVEACLKATVNSFRCHDFHDRGILEKIMDSVIGKNQRRPGIITASFENTKYNLDGAIVRCDRYPTMLDIVTVEHPVMFNTLVDEAGADSILFIEDGEAGRNFMRFEAPRNCRMAFTQSGDQVYGGCEQRYYSNTTKQVRVLGADVETQINFVQDELKKKQRELAELDTKINESNSFVKDNTKQKDIATVSKHKLQQNVGKLTMSINELKSVEEPIPVDVTTLEEEVQLYNSQIAELEEKKEEVEQARDQAQQAMKDANQTFEATNAAIQELAEKVEPLQEQMSNLMQEVEEKKRNRQHYEGAMKTFLDTLELLKNNLEVKRRELEENTEQASQVCPKPEQGPSNRTAKNIDSEIHQIQKRIRSEERNQGDPDEIRRQYHEAVDKFKAIQEHIANFKTFKKNLELVIVDRQKAYGEFLRLLALRARQCFCVTLSGRNYTGRLKFIHDQKVLQLVVKPTQGSQEAKDMRSLSGGERSFSTVCFLLALWDCMTGGPFRALDEFDVFMDMINRKIAMEMILGAAEEKIGHQYILLTPLDMSSHVANNPLVRISRMLDPK